MTPHRLELEALDSVEELLQSYDPVTDQWRFLHDGSFWEAVKHAHDIGCRGQGRRVAIVDSGCNTKDYPRLARQIGKVRQLVDAGADGKIQEHGTAVALLITEVAPDCVLDIYGVVAEYGIPTESAVIDAIAEAAQSSAIVINLSLGKAQALRLIPDSKDARSDDQRNSYTVSEREPCQLCTAASRAAEAGKLVYAAVRNSFTDTYCPARADGVVAVGFQERKQMKPVPDKDIKFLFPVLQQAVDTDLMLLGVPGAIGSSFASPLYAGVGALGLTKSELWGFIASYSDSVEPLRLHAQVDTTVGMASAQPDLLENIERGYWKSFSSIPHSHCDVQSGRFPELPRSDPTKCPFCGIFANAQYTNLGYWLFGRRRAAEAINLLEAARALCPWDDEPVAFEGSAYYMLGASDRAIQNYELALRMRPGHGPYIDTLRAISLLSGNERGILPRPPRTPAPELTLMSDLERTQWRRGVTRKLNWFYYALTGGLLSFHIINPASALANWSLLISIIIGFIFASQDLADARLSNLQANVPGDYPTRREMRSFTWLLRISAACFSLTAVGLLLLLVLGIRAQ